MLFWKETGKFGELSNWYACDIRCSILGQVHVYESGEQLFMARKAASFGDLKAVEKLQEKGS